MTKDEINKKLIFAEMVMGAINNLEVPMLMYEAEKQVVKEALLDNTYKLEQELRGR